MFIKTVPKTDQKTGTRYNYLRLCESYRVGKLTRHKNIVSMGIVPELDTLEKKKKVADKIEQLLKNQAPIFDLELDDALKSIAEKFYQKIKQEKLVSTDVKVNKEEKSQKKDIYAVDVNSVQAEDVREIGSEWLCKQAIEKLGLNTFFSNLGWTTIKTNRALIHLISRCVFPASENNTAQWINENSSVSELYGIESHKISRYMLYEASRNLYEKKSEIETYLSLKTNEIFDLEDKIVLYDLTNTYFEGRKATSILAQFGRSKEKRSDAKLVSLALATNQQGFVKYSKIYQGNIAETSTLEKMVEELSKGSSATGRKPTVVIDAGIASEENLKMLKREGYSYLCVTRSKLKDYQVLEGNDIVTLTDNREHKITVQKVTKEDCEDVFLHVISEEKAKKEEAMSVQSSTGFEALLRVIEKGILSTRGTKQTAKVWQRIGRAKERFSSVASNYDISLKEENGIATSIQWTKKEAKKKHGEYFLRSSVKELSNTDLWKIYNTLTEIEATFRVLKTDLSLRPVYHKTDENTEAHIFLGILAYAIVNTIRQTLKQKKIRHSWKKIVQIMNTQKSVTITMDTEKQEKIYLKTCSKPTQGAIEIYNALNYKSMPYYTKKIVVLPQ